MAFYFTPTNIILFFSVILYLGFDYFDGKRIKDEREELIKLKAFELVQKINTYTLLLLSIAYFFISYIDGVLVIFILVLSSLYSEIVAKIWFRKKL